MTYQLEIRHIQYFLTLANTLHYGKAAQELYISQSALSQQIQRLETILGKQLFERHNRKVELSTAGEYFKEEAVIILNQLNQSLDRWQYKIEGGEGILRIGFVASAMQTFLPDVIRNFGDVYPKVKFYLEDKSNRAQINALENKDLDIAFMRSKGNTETMHRMPVLIENLTLVLPHDHPIDKHNFENIGQFANDSFILFPNNKSQMYFQKVLNLCNEHGFTPQIKHRSIHGPTIFKLVESGMGISIIPNSLRDEHNYKVKYIEMDQISQKTKMYAVWNKDSTNIALKNFIEMLKYKSFIEK